jgi:hypothetical protein
MIGGRGSSHVSTTRRLLRDAPLRRPHHGDLCHLGIKRLLPMAQGQDPRRCHLSPICVDTSRPRAPSAASLSEWPHSISIPCQETPKGLPEVPPIAVQNLRFVVSRERAEAWRLCLALVSVWLLSMAVSQLLPGAAPSYAQGTARPPLDQRPAGLSKKGARLPPHPLRLNFLAS